MHRQTDYAYQVPYETDFLYAQRFGYEALGLALFDILGISTLVSGLALVPTGPASLFVNMGPGRIYSLQNLEDTAWGLFNAVGGLPVDTNADHKIIKQGLYRDTTALSCPAPGTAGQSINYLIEAAFSEVDAVPISLPFVSSTAPYAPVAPNTLDTVRQDKCIITVKAGVAAATGTQTTPAPDSGNVGLYVVTVANGQTQITSGNIAVYGSAPFITETLTQKISQTTADGRYAKPVDVQAQAGNYAADTGTANAYACTLAPVLAGHVVGLPIRVKIAHSCTGASTFNPGPGAKNVKRPDGSPLQAADLQAGSIATFVYDGAQYLVPELISLASLAAEQSLGAVTLNNSSTPVVIYNGVDGLVRVFFDDASGNTYSALISHYQFATSYTPGCVTIEGTPGTMSFASNGSGNLTMSRSGGPASVSVTVRRVDP